MKHVHAPYIPMTTVLTPVLANHNAHPRDEYIVFHEEGHSYDILCDPDNTYISVTTFIHMHFDKFDSDSAVQAVVNGRGWKEGHKYWGMSGDEMKAMWEEMRDSAAQAGTALHYAIECFHNRPALPYPYTYAQLLEEHCPRPADQFKVEWNYFLKFVADHPHFKPYRTEWTIYDEETKIAGSIDMVFENEDGSLSIYDWKRSKEIKQAGYKNKMAISPAISHLPDANFWHYTLQLNFYKYILETHYGKKVRDLCLVRLHPNALSYEVLPLPLMDREVTDLMRVRMTQLPIKV